MKVSNTAERLRELMEKRDLKQVDVLQLTKPYCDELGVKMHKSDISQYVNGKVEPQQEKLFVLAAALDVSEGWLMGYDVPMKRISDADRFAAFANDFNKRNFPDDDPVRVPVLGRVAAGIPINAIEEIIDWEELPAHTVNNDTYFGLRIKGNSMEPNIGDGDVVIVKEQDTAEDGQIVIALVNGDDATCKRLKVYDNGTIALMSDNPSYPPMYFNNVEIDNVPVKIIGVVKELRRKF